MFENVLSSSRTQCNVDMVGLHNLGGGYTELEVNKSWRHFKQCTFYYNKSYNCAAFY